MGPILQFTPLVEFQDIKIDNMGKLHHFNLIGPSIDYFKHLTSILSYHWLNFICLMFNNSFIHIRLNQFHLKFGSITNYVQEFNHLKRSLCCLNTYSLRRNISHLKATSAKTMFK